MKTILITGSAGFIGSYLTKELLEKGFTVIGIDNINSYYDPKLKEVRLNEIKKFVIKNNYEDNYQFIKLDISNDDGLNNLFSNNNIDIVINLAAQAGVRYSLDNPKAYIDSNLNGFMNVLECCRNYDIEHMIYASSSSVYGMNIEQPFSTESNTDYPISLYAATKKSNELLAFSYSHLFKIPVTGLRFFTVYGPYGRPDMAYYKFAKAIQNGEPIEVYNHGNMMRDFTYIDDIIEGISRLVMKIPEDSNFESTYAMAPYKVYNIGNNNPVKLIDFIKIIEKYIGKKAIINMLPMQPGDVPITYADIDDLHNDIGFKPNTSIENGLKKFVNWYISQI
jgi:UDP-glucuronate 4-epimerase